MPIEKFCPTFTEDNLCEILSAGQEDEMSEE